MQRLYILVSGLRLLPHIILLNCHKNKKIIQYDVSRWLKLKNKETNIQYGFMTLMTIYPEFRNLFYKRLGRISILINWLCPKMNTLFIMTKDIGPGLYINHGFATIISAKSIGRDCWINQQVTIGFTDKMESPQLGDNVSVHAGAKIIGGIKMGNNSKAGANAVVTKDVPANCVVVGIPAYIIRRDGVRVNRDLKSTLPSDIG